MNKNEESQEEMGRSSGADGFVRRCLLLVVAHRRAGESTAASDTANGSKAVCLDYGLAVEDGHNRYGATRRELEEIHFCAYFNHKDELHFTSDFREGA